MPHIERVRLRVSGRVQGVNFRYYASEEARRRGVTGWVLNRDDGVVEILAEGAADAVARFVGWCRRGPSYARVDDVDQERLEGERRYGDFSIVYDAPE